MATEHEPKYPRINVEMIGEDGNAFSILGRAFKAIRRSDYTPEERETIRAQFQATATGGDYNHLLRTVMEYFTIDGEQDAEPGELEGELEEVES